MFFTAKFIVYGLLYCFPMFVYFNSDNKSEQIIFLIPSLLVSILLFFYEILQVKSQGFEYFKDVWNWIDILGFVSFWMLCYNQLIEHLNSLDESEVYLMTIVII